MLSRAFRPIAATILLLTGAPTQAAPVSIREVIQVLGNHQNPPQLRLRSVTQTTNSSVNDTEGPSPTVSAAQQSAAGNVVEIADASTDIVTSDSADTLLAGVAVSADPQAGVDVVDQGDAEGTICDCGEITVPGGGFPKWPLLFLAAIPLFFIHDCDHCEVPIPPTTPTPPRTPEIPEPASLLLFGSGLALLGAGLRRRYARRKPETQLQTAEKG